MENKAEENKNVYLAIQLQNVQSIQDYTFLLPRRGVVEFTGDNNNGKSVLLKVLKKITNLEIYSETERNALISWGADRAVISLANATRELYFILARDRASCRYAYRARGETEFVERTFADKEELIKQLDLFGFGVFGKSRFCIQLHEINGTIPFSNNSDPKEDAEIIESITKDTFAESCLDNYKNYTEPAFKQHYNMLRIKENELNNTLATLQMYDTSKYREILAEIDDVLDSRGLQQLELIKLNLERYEYIPIMNLKLLDMTPYIPRVNLIKLEVPAVRVPIMRLNNLSEDLNNIKNIEQHKCPTCGQYIA